MLCIVNNNFQLYGNRKNQIHQNAITLYWRYHNQCSKNNPQENPPWGVLNFYLLPTGCSIN